VFCGYQLGAQYALFSKLICNRIALVSAVILLVSVETGVGVCRGYRWRLLGLALVSAGAGVGFCGAGVCVRGAECTELAVN